MRNFDSRRPSWTSSLLVLPVLAFFSGLSTAEGATLAQCNAALTACRQACAAADKAVAGFDLWGCENTCVGRQNECTGTDASGMPKTANPESPPSKGHHTVATPGAGTTNQH